MMKINIKIIMLAIAGVMSTQNVFSMDSESGKPSELHDGVFIGIPVPDPGQAPSQQAMLDSAPTRGRTADRSERDVRHRSSSRKSKPSRLSSLLHRGNPAKEGNIVGVSDHFRARSRSRYKAPLQRAVVSQPKESASYCGKCVHASLRGCVKCCDVLVDCKERHPVVAGSVLAGCCVVCGCSVESASTALVSTILRSAGCCSKAAYCLGVCLCAKAIRDSKR